MVIPNIRAQIVGDCFVVSLLAMTVLFLVPQIEFGDDIAGEAWLPESYIGRCSSFSLFRHLRNANLKIEHRRTNLPFRWF